MNAIDLTKFPAIGIPGISQVGIVVLDIDEAVQYYTDLWKIRPWFRANTTIMDAVYRGRKINLEVDIVFAFSKKIMIELIQPLNEKANIYNEHIKNHGAGLHHLGIEVKDFDKKLKSFSSKGINPIQSGQVVTKGGSITRYAYLDTIASCGYPLELIETRLHKIPLKNNRWLMEAGCLIGDATKL